MIKKIILTGGIRDIELAPKVHALEFFCQKTDISPLCIDLILLRYQMIDRIMFEAQGGPNYFWRYNPALDVSSVAREKNCMAVELSTNDFESIHSFLLYFCRDGYTPVDHLDIELALTLGGTEYSLVIRTDLFRSPMSSDEARRLLGLANDGLET